jgi:hypothetical protein
VTVTVTSTTKAEGPFDIAIGNGQSADPRFQNNVVVPNKIAVTVAGGTPSSSTGGPAPVTPGIRAATVTVLIKLATDASDSAVTAFRMAFTEQVLIAADVKPCPACMPPGRVSIIGLETIAGDRRILTFAFLDNDPSDSTDVFTYRARFLAEWSKIKDSTSKINNTNAQIDIASSPGSIDNAVQCTTAGVCVLLDCPPGQVYFKGSCYTKCPLDWEPDEQAKCRDTKGWDITVGLIAGIIITVLVLIAFTTVVYVAYKKQLRKGGGKKAKVAKSSSKAALNSTELTTV